MECQIYKKAVREYFWPPEPGWFTKKVGTFHECLSEEQWSCLGLSKWWLEGNFWYSIQPQGIFELCHSKPGKECRISWYGIHIWTILYWMTLYF